MGRYYYKEINTATKDQYWNLSKFSSAANNAIITTESASDGTYSSLSGDAASSNSNSSTVSRLGGGGLRGEGGYMIEQPVIIILFTFYNGSLMAYEDKDKEDGYNSKTYGMDWLYLQCFGWCGYDHKNKEKEDNYNFF